MLIGDVGAIGAGFFVLGRIAFVRKIIRKFSYIIFVNRYQVDL